MQRLPSILRHNFSLMATAPLNSYKLRLYLPSGFLMRPIGAWVMGIYADRKGRKAGLTVSVSLMCVGSLIIACAPTYACSWYACPAILLLARLLQGLSVGGEYGSSATYLTEMAGKNHRGFFSSFQYVTLISGQLLALCVLIILQRNLSEQALTEWGWRVPFFIGALLRDCRVLDSSWLGRNTVI